MQLSRRCRRLRDPVEVADILAGLFDDLRTVVATGALMFGDDGPRAQGLDSVEGGDPLAPTLGAGLTKV